jgi:hypothetical protein
MRRFWIIAPLILLQCSALSLGVTLQDDVPPPIAENVVSAWEKRGLAPGWIRFADGGFVTLVESSQRRPGDLPNFWLVTPSPGSLVGLPSPDRGFSILAFPGPGGRTANLGNQDMKALGEMPQLVSLSLTNTRPPDGSIKELHGAKALRKLLLVKNGLGDAGIAGISALESLESLSLNDNVEITNAALDEVGKLKRLRWLSLGHTRVTDLKALAGLENLEALFLSGDKLGAAGFDGLASFEKLQELYLSGSNVTDADLKKVARLERLRVLQLNSTAITDDGLAHLTKLTNLRTLAVRGTAVTDAGVEKLRGALPDAKIQR